MIKIGLVDDHVLIRKGLSVLIELLPGFEVGLQASNGEELITQLEKKPVPDIILSDVSMPQMDGVETAQWLRQYYPAIKVVVLTMHADKTVARRMIQSGARAYLLKDTDPGELAAAIQDVHTTGYHFNHWVKPFARKHAPPATSGIVLNAQELMFLRLTCTGKSHKEIASEMCVSPRTIDGYRDALFRKLNVCSKVGMVMYALKNEIVTL